MATVSIKYIFKLYFFVCITAFILRSQYLNLKLRLYFIPRSVPAIASLPSTPPTINVVEMDVVVEVAREGSVAEGEPVSSRAEAEPTISPAILVPSPAM